MQQAVPLGGTKNPVCLHPGMDPGQTSQQMDSWQEEKGGEAPGAAKKVLTLHLLYPPDYIQTTGQKPALPSHSPGRADGHNHFGDVAAFIIYV